MLSGCEFVSGKRFTGSVDSESNPLLESKLDPVRLVEDGKGSFDAVLAGLPNRSLLVAGEFVPELPSGLSGNSLPEVPKGSSLPNGVDEVVEGPLSSGPNSLSAVAGCGVPNSLPGSVSLPEPELADKSVDNDSFKPPPLSDVSGPRSNSPVGCEVPLSAREPKGSFVKDSELLTVVPNGSLPVAEPNSLELPGVSG